MRFLSEPGSAALNRDGPGAFLQFPPTRVPLTFLPVRMSQGACMFTILDGPMAIGLHHRPRPPGYLCPGIDLEPKPPA